MSIASSFPQLTRAQSILRRVTRPDTMTVMRKSIVSDGSGGQVDTYTAVATHSCSLTPQMVTPREVEQTAQIQVVSIWEVHTDVDADIVPTDRLVVGDRTFEVIRGNYRTVNVDLVVMCHELI